MQTALTKLNQNGTSAKPLNGHATKAMPALSVTMTAETPTLKTWAIVTIS